MVYNQKKNMISCPYLTKRTKAALLLLNGAHPAKRSVVDVLAHVRSTAARAFHAFTTFLLMKIKGIIKCLFIVLFPLHVSGYFVSIFST